MVATQPVNAKGRARVALMVDMSAMAGQAAAYGWATLISMNVSGLASAVKPNFS
jgi:hypothetical protein